MKKKGKKLLAVSLLGALLFSLFSVNAFAAQEYNPPGNLIENPGLEAEDYTTGWQASENGILIKTPVLENNPNVHSGIHALGIVALPEAENGAFAYQDVLIPEDGQYELTAYTKTYLKPDSGARLYMSIASHEKELILGTTEWQKLTISFSAPRNATQRVAFWTAAAGSFLFDDVSLVRTGDAEFPNSLLQNGGFEQSLVSWNAQGSACAFSTTAQKLSGQSSVYMGYFTIEPLHNYIEQTYVSDKNGIYTFTAYVHTEQGLSGAGAILFLDAKDAAGKVLSTAASAAVSDSAGGWTKLQVSLSTPTGTQSVTAKIGGVYCVGAFYVDDARLTFSNSFPQK